MKVKGSCLCQSVNFEFETTAPHFDSCHCRMCRNWGGGPVFTVEVKKDLKIEGEENVSVFQSSEWAERGFCSQCGTHLFYRLKNHELCNFNLGTIEGHEQFEFKTQIYVDSQPKNYEFANQTEMMTEAEVLKAFGAEE